MSTVSIQSHKALTTYTLPEASKSLSTTTKTLSGSLDGSSDMGVWMEEASAWFTWYNGIMSGTIALQPGEVPPTEADYALMQEYWMYATGTSWGESVDYSSEVPYGEPESVPSGAILGPYDNVVWDSGEIELYHTDDIRAQDIYAGAFSLDVSSYSAQVTIERTSDTRIDPAEEVTKVTVANQATGCETVYYYHGDDPITIRTSEQSQLVDNTGGVYATWEQYVETTEETEEIVASYSGGEVEIDENDPLHYTHTADSGDTIDFNPQPNEAGVEVHEVFGDSNITLRSDYSADESWVQVLDENGETDDFASYHLIKVYDNEGNEIAQYKVHKGNSVHLNMNEEYLTHTTIDDATGEEVTTKISDFTPDHPNSDWWSEDFSVNGELAVELTDPTPEADETDATDETDVETEETDETDVETETDAAEEEEIANKVEAANAAIDALETSTGLKEQDILDLLMNTDIYYSQLSQYGNKLSPEEFETAVAEGFNFPPATPDAKFFAFLYNADPKLKTALDALILAKDMPYINTDFAYNAVRDRLVTVLKGVYGDVAVKADDENDGKGKDNVWFNGQEYDIFNDLDYTGDDPWGYLQFGLQSS